MADSIAHFLAKCLEITSLTSTEISIDFVFFEVQESIEIVHLLLIEAKIMQLT